MNYIPTPEQNKKRETNFTYHAPKGDQADRYSEIREMAKTISVILDKLCPQSRELSLAMTKLEEAVFWANAAIARNEKVVHESPVIGGDQDNPVGHA